MNITSKSSFELKHLFGISYLWFSLIAVFNVFIIGILTSYLTGFKKLETLDDTLYIDVFKLRKIATNVSYCNIFGTNFKNKINFFFLIKKNSNKIEKDNNELELLNEHGKQLKS